LNQLSFLLCPDRTSARRVRRLVAEKRPGTDILVGTWPELLKHARDAYLLGDIEDTWSVNLALAATTIPTAFWSKSLALALPETLGILDRTLRDMLGGVGPDKSLEEPASDTLSERGTKHLSDLAKLHSAMNQQLPPELSAINEMLKSDSAKALKTLTVCALPELPTLNPWQQALVDKLNSDAATQKEPYLEDLLVEGCGEPHISERPADLAFLQDNLYTTPEESVSLDGSIQWLAVRDYLQEAEVAVGMIQKALSEHPDLSPSDFGLLLPDETRYAQSVRDVFEYAGIPLAGLIETRGVRDLGRELVFYLLLSLKKPAPAMAFAALLASPLLPWGRTEGLGLAQAVMNGNFRLEKMSWPASGKILLKTLVKGAEKPDDLVNVLDRVESHLSDDELLSGELEMSRSLLVEIRDRLRDCISIPWEELISMSAPVASNQTIEDDVPQEGIAVFQEGHEAWRPVRHLFVLGFNAGHYPRESGFSPVFSESDQALLKEKFHFAIETSTDLARHRRHRFLRQLGYASDRINFLLSRRDATGKGLAPSASLTFMARLFGQTEPDDLIMELDTAIGRKKATGLSLALPVESQPPRDLHITDLKLDCDLLALKTRDDGTLYPMSPSRLETLMVSPFAWVLGRSGLAPREWAPEELDVASKGTLAHAVFEWLFPVGSDLPDESTIRERVPGLLNRAISQSKPFLLGAEWQVERNHLENETLVAALRWRNLLEELGARILGPELWLEGHLDGIPLHGSADLLIGLPNGRLYVIDYKKSKSKKRKERMQAAFDSQASLYRIMLETGGVSSKMSPEAQETLKQATEIGVLYYLMNDQVALADTDGWLSADLEGVEELAGDVSSEALKLIRQRLVEVKNGVVCLNAEDDEKWFDKNAGISKLYALDNSPLLRLFMHPPREVSL
jgi:ATP-dependent helicase/nuclease subunit B